MSEYDLVCILHADVQCVVSLSDLNGKSCRSKHTVRHVVQEPPTRSGIRWQLQLRRWISRSFCRMRPPDVEDVVRSKAAVVVGNGLELWDAGIHTAERGAQELLRIKET